MMLDPSAAPLVSAYSLQGSVACDILRRSALSDVLGTDIDPWDDEHVGSDLGGVLTAARPT